MYYFNVNNRLSDAIPFIFSKFCYLCSHTRKRKTIKCFQSTLPIIYTIGRFCLTLSVIEKISIFCKLKDKKCVLKLISQAILILRKKKFAQFLAWFQNKEVLKQQLGFFFPFELLSIKKFIPEKNMTFKYIMSNLNHFTDWLLFSWTLI